jgi:hypothetical protein
MHLLAVDGSRPDPALGDALEELLAKSRAQKVLAFGAAAISLRDRARAEREVAEERFFDDAAGWLLSSREGQPPRRGAGAGFAEKVTVVTREAAEDFAPLAVVDRAVELAGRVIVMALPGADDLEGETLENAAVWIVGGASEPRLQAEETRLLLAPGPDATRVLSVRVDAEAVRAARLDLSGTIIDQAVLPLGAKTRMSVRG